MRTIGIIPARYHSKRFPGKPLAKIDGRSLIQHVYDKTAECTDLNELFVATDDIRIFDHVNRFGKVIMTNPNHPSGTDRCLEAYEKINKNNGFNDNDLLINIQGDQPFIMPEQITSVIETLKSKSENIATLMTKITDPESVLSNDVVKVVYNKKFKALYFSRSPIPFCQLDQKINYPTPAMKHIGIYGFRIKTLKQICHLPQSNLELLEGLEQLRWLENGFEIQLKESAIDSICIDRPEHIICS